MLEQKNLYCHEACQMPKTIKEEVLQLEPVLESCRACKFSELTHICDVFVVKLCQSNIKCPTYIFTANGELFIQDASRFTITVVLYIYVAFHLKTIVLLKAF